MTIGQRIATIRKDNQLSQEAFGEQLGVSRQAISKWESDASIPDVEKLILLSRTYGVSINWILGIEETAPISNSEEPPLPPLNQEQLDMVQAITDGYIHALPKTTKKRKKVALLWAVILIGAGLWAGFWVKDRLWESQQ